MALIVYREEMIVFNIMWKKDTYYTRNRWPESCNVLKCIHVVNISGTQNGINNISWSDKYFQYHVRRRICYNTVVGGPNLALVALIGVIILCNVMWNRHLQILKIIKWTLQTLWNRKAQRMTEHQYGPPYGPSIFFSFFFLLFLNSNNPKALKK